MAQLTHGGQVVTKQQDGSLLYILPQDQFVKEGQLVQDQEGVPEIRICTFELLRKVQSPSLL